MSNDLWRMLGSISMNQLYDVYKNWDHESEEEHWEQVESNILITQNGKDHIDNMIDVNFWCECDRLKESDYGIIDNSNCDELWQVQIYKCYLDEETGYWDSEHLNPMELTDEFKNYLKEREHNKRIIKSYSIKEGRNINAKNT